MTWLSYIEVLLATCNCLHYSCHFDYHTFIWIWISAVHIIFILFHTTNWPAQNAWVFKAQLAEHCSANAKAMGSTPVEVPNFFIRVNLQLLELQLLLRRSYLHLNFKKFVRSKICSLLQTKITTGMRAKVARQY